VLEGPPGETFAALQLDLADQACVRVGRCAQNEALAVAFEQVDEARVDGARVGQEPDDPVENLLEVEGGTDRRDDLVEEALLDSVRSLAGSDASIVRLRICQIQVSAR
jgi:hypothetical protein